MAFALLTATAHMCERLRLLAASVTLFGAVQTALPAAAVTGHYGATARGPAVRLHRDRTSHESGAEGGRK